VARSADQAGTLDDASWLMPAAEILCGWLLTRWAQYDVFPRHRVDDAMVKALSSGSRWRNLLETGVYSTIEEIAAAEKINASYVGRLLRLTLLAPEIVEASLDGRHAGVVHHAVQCRRCAARHPIAQMPRR
jgi:hypothetical protein